MPNNKYKHIKLPPEMVRDGGSHTFRQPPFPQPPVEFDVNVHKRNLTVRSDQLVDKLTTLKTTRKLAEDKNVSEVEILFRGYPDNNFLKKYGVTVYQKEEDRVIGKINDVKLPGQKLSDFEQLRNDIAEYVDNNKLPSYFGKLEDISPLELDDVIDANLKEEYQDDPTKELMVDISFADDKDTSEIKLSAMKEEYGDHFISSVNLDSVHFTRVVTDYEKLKTVVSEYGGISYIEQSPEFEILTSAADTPIRNTTVVPLSGNESPIFIFDKPINHIHKTLQGAIVEQIGSTTGSKSHGTAVASLVVCGGSLHPDEPIVQQNSIIAVNVFDNNKVEETIKKVIEDYSARYPLILANLSVNRYGKAYKRSRVDNFTVMLDELSHKHNCLFFISAGNIKELLEDQAVATDAITLGYPNHFARDYSYLLPPADSINNVSVGSVAYQQSANSVAHIKNPVPFTRVNFPDNGFIKPDFVHYDGNLRINGGKFLSEENGVICASEDANSLTNRLGTSFSSPLVANMAGILHNLYPRFTVNSIRGLLTQFANQVDSEQVTDEDLKRRLIGFGMPDLDRTLYSLSSAATIVVEDEIGMDKKKVIKIPIPSSIQGDTRKRLKIHITLVYRPPINPKDVGKYAPVNLLARLVRSDDYEMNSPTTRGRRTEAYSKSNVKRYPPVEVSTKKHTGSMWKVEVFSEKRSDEVPANYMQSYSLVVTVEDTKENSEVDLYNDIIQMIEVETHIDIPIEIAAS